jgi:hypothetical protein
LQATRLAAPWVAVAEGDGLGAAAIREGNTIAPESFCSAGLDGAVASGTLRHKAHQHNSKSELEESKFEVTSVPTSSLQSAPDSASSVESYHHQWARHQKWKHVTFGETPQIYVQK